MSTTNQLPMDASTLQLAERVTLLLEERQDAQRWLHVEDPEVTDHEEIAYWETVLQDVDDQLDIIQSFLQHRLFKKKGETLMAEAWLAVIISNIEKSIHRKEMQIGVADRSI